MPRSPHNWAMRAMKPGVTEREISRCSNTNGQRGCERPSYSPIVGLDSIPRCFTIPMTRAPYRREMLWSSTRPANIPCTPRHHSHAARERKIHGRQREIYDIVLAPRTAIGAFQSGKSTLSGIPQLALQVAYDYINTHGKDLHGEPWASTSSTAWVTTSASPCMTLTTTPSRSGPGCLHHRAGSLYSGRETGRAHRGPAVRGQRR